MLTGPQYHDIPEALVEKLCQLLDPPNRGWEDLVRTLIGEKHVKNFEILHEPSPTKGVLEHLKVSSKLLGFLAKMCGEGGKKTEGDSSGDLIRDH